MDNHVGSFTVDEGVDQFGTRKQIIFDGDQLVSKTTYDAEPFLKRAHEARVATEGQRWGEGLGTKVGEIPMAVYAQAIAMPDAEQRRKFVMNWLRENPAMVTFSKFLK